MGAPKAASPAVDDAALSPDAQRLVRFIRMNEWGGPVGVVIVVFVWMAAEAYSAGYPLLIAGLSLNWVLIRSALWLTRRERLRTAVLAIASGLWLISLLLGLVLPMVYAVAAIVALMPVAITVWLAGSYMGRSALTAVCVASVAVALIGGIASVSPPLFGIAENVHSMIVFIVHVFVVPSMIGITVFTFTFSSQRLVEAIDEVRTSNRALSESERSLERKVEERTAALEDSYRQLAEARDAALDANRAKSDFLANMSHELRTPLNAIIGYGEMLQEEAQDDGNESHLSDLERIVSSGRYLLSLINGVLDLSKIEAGKMEVHAEPFDVGELVRDVVATIQPLVQKNANTLDCVGDESAGPMHSDVTKLRQVLLNLLSNATKFTREGRISLEIERAPADEGAPWITFRVRDTGIGMTPEQLEGVFEAFSQADASTTREYGGTGLGLAITRQFCTMLGGTIDATSEPGVGSVFEVRLPQRAPEAQASPRPGAGAAGRATTVLVVDDDASARELVSRFLKRKGYEVVTAADGRQALRIARERTLDVITLDVLMPEMDGWEVLRALKSDPANASTPVILLTVTENASLGYALGAADFLTKPIDWDRLSAVVARYRPAERSALVVDDEESARDLARRMLERAGWRVTEAENGRAALESLADARPTLILLDLMMPEMDGFEFVAELRSNPAWASVPVVVITAKDVTAEEQARLKGSVSRIFQKGAYTLDDLGDEIRRLTDASADDTVA